DLVHLAGAGLALHGRDFDAARLEGAADAMGFEHSDDPTRDEYLRELLLQARHRLGEAKWAAAEEEGKRLRLRGAIELIAAALAMSEQPAGSLTSVSYGCRGRDAPA